MERRIKRNFLRRLDHDRERKSNRFIIDPEIDRTR